MLFHCFIWGFALLCHHAVNSAPNLVEREQNFSAKESDIHPTVGEILVGSEVSERSSRDSDFEGRTVDYSTQFPEIEVKTIGGVSVKLTDSDVTHLTSLDSDYDEHQFSTTFIPENSEEHAEEFSSRLHQDNSSSSLFVESNTTLPTFTSDEKEIKEENEDISTKTGFSPFGEDDHSRTYTGNAFSISTFPAKVDVSNPLNLRSSIASDETEETNFRQAVPATINEYDEKYETEVSRSTDISAEISNRNHFPELSTVGLDDESHFQTKVLTEKGESLNSSTPIKWGSLEEEERQEVTSGLHLKNNAEFDNETENKTTDSFPSKDSFDGNQFLTPPSTKNSELDFEEHTEKYAPNHLSEFVESMTKTSDIESTNNIMKETTSESDTANSTLHSVDIQKKNQNISENFDYNRNSTPTVSSTFTENDSIFTERKETSTLHTGLTDFSRNISANESDMISDVTGTTETLPLESTSLSVELNSNPVKVPIALEANIPKDAISKVDEYHERYLSGNNTDTIAAVQFLHYHDKASSEQCHKLVKAHWNYATNLTEENKKKQLDQTFEYSQFHKKAWKNATSFAWKSFNDTLLRRWFKSLSILGNSALPEAKLNEFNRLKADMKNTYSTAKVCSYSSVVLRNESHLGENKCDLTLEPDLTRILTRSRDYEELLHVWKAWRDAAGKPIRDKYLRLVELSNEAAFLNGFTDAGDMWREAYESENFQEDLEQLWDQLRPLYEHLHAYVRRKLIKEYTTDKIQEDGPIPAHLLGNMWAQSWVSLLDITQPFPGKPSVDVTATMEARNMSALQMFKVSEEFFTSLGLKPMPEEFWKHSLIEKPKDREIICHASAWDFCNGKDYRIKQCTDITMEDLITVHHEMGHIEYFLQYSRQPNVFREGANPGFHEAIGDVLALSVSTPKHLKSIGLLEDVADDPEGDLNFLLRTALDKISFIPSGYLIDLWRWGLFSGKFKPEEMNSKWWELRLKYQGICPPVKRTESDFDPGAKYHVPGNVPYIRYFVSFVIQFQFHKVLCDAAGHTGPLYKCDIYKSKEAGQILSQVMELGSSEHWSKAMKIMTGGATEKMDAQPILEYFNPLLIWLQEQNKNETLGWKSNDATACP